MSERLLSICIPTYNRAQALDLVLQSIVSDPCFDACVEVIICDNASEDSTASVAAKYTGKYQNVFYWRNDENIRDRNFTKILSMGIGSYLKLVNDYSLFEEGSLGFMLEKIQLHKDEKPLLFFYSLYKNPRRVITCDSLDTFVNTVSFLMTWIGFFGAWKEDFQRLEDKDRCAPLCFVQVDWTLRLVGGAPRTIVYNRQLFGYAPLEKKGEYSFFQVFTENYPSMYAPYRKSGQVSWLTFQREKYRLLRSHLLHYFIRINVLERSKYNFPRENSFGILLKNYWYYPYFFPGLVVMFFYGIKLSIKIK